VFLCQGISVSLCRLALNLCTFPQLAGCNKRHGSTNVEDEYTTMHTHHTHNHTYTRTHSHTHTHTYTHTYTHLHTRTHTRTHICSHIHTHVHTHMHTTIGVDAFMKCICVSCNRCRSMDLLHIMHVCLALIFLRVTQKWQRRHTYRHTQFNQTFTNDASKVAETSHTSSHTTLSDIHQ